MPPKGTLALCAPRHRTPHQVAWPDGGQRQERRPSRTRRPGRHVRGLRAGAGRAGPWRTGTHADHPAPANHRPRPLHGRRGGSASGWSPTSRLKRGGNDMAGRCPVDLACPYQAAVAWYGLPPRGRSMPWARAGAIAGRARGAGSGRAALGSQWDSGGSQPVVGGALADPVAVSYTHLTLPTKRIV